MAKEGTFKLRIRATQLDRVSVNGLIRMDMLGRLAFGMMKQRVTKRHVDEQERPLPPYKVKVYKVRAPWVKRKGVAPVDGSDRRVQATPPDIFQQIRALGGVIHKGDKWKGGEPIRYSPKSAVKDKRGQVWGYRWATPEDFIRHNYGGGTAVNHSSTGRMWNSPRIAPKAPVRGDMSVTVGFRGAVPRGGVYNVMKRIKREARERIAAGRRPRAVNASTKAYLANARDSQGKVTHSGGAARQWLGLSDKEMTAVLRAMNTTVLQGLERLPITVVVR